MKRAAPRVPTWFVMSFSSLSLSNRSCETTESRLLVAISCSLFLVPRTRRDLPGLVVRSNPCRHGSVTIPTGEAMPDRHGLGGDVVKSGAGRCAPAGGELGELGKDGKHLRSQAEPTTTDANVRFGRTDAMSSTRDPA